MTVYIRTYKGHSYELLLSEGRFKKNRLHLLINPGTAVKLQGHAKKADTEVNVQSLTHIISMETSVKDPKKLDRANKIAQLTNRPIITNEETAKIFRQNGISRKQIRVIGYEEEVIDKLVIDPVYIEELQKTASIQTLKENHSSKPKSDNDEDIEENSKEENQANFIKVIGTFTKNVVKTLNPLNWTEKIKETVDDFHQPDVDPTLPIAIYVKIRTHDSVLFPLDSRAIDELNLLIQQLKPKIVLLPNAEVSATLSLPPGAKKILIIHDTHNSEQTINIPKMYNPTITHDTIYGSFEEWILVEE